MQVPRQLLSIKRRLMKNLPKLWIFTSNELSEGHGDQTKKIFVDPQIRDVAREDADAEGEFWQHFEHWTSWA